MPIIIAIIVLCIQNQILQVKSSLLKFKQVIMTF